MHSSLLILAVLIALLWRWRWQVIPEAGWTTRWQNAVISLCLPALILLSTAVSVVWMGHHGRMVGLPVSPIGCWVAIGCIGTACSVLVYLAGQAIYSSASLRRLPVVDLGYGQQARYLPSLTPWAARLGFWNADLIVSQGFFSTLSEPERQAVLCHEQAHLFYRDTFWFFWLGWLRRLTTWLPQTEILWQELLLLREIRADRRALQETDALLLAEVIIKMATCEISPSISEHQIGFSNRQTVEHLSQRIDALLDSSTLTSTPALPTSGWLLLSGLAPLAIVLLHH